jgi:hypothetical protein
MFKLSMLDTLTGYSEFKIFASAERQSDGANYTGDMRYAGGDTWMFNGAVQSDVGVEAFDFNHPGGNWMVGYNNGGSAGGTNVRSIFAGGGVVLGEGTLGDRVIFQDNVIFKTVSAINASDTQTQGQGALTGDISEISVCATTNDTVTLVSAVQGMWQLVINNGAETLQIFPASGDDCGAGVDTAVTLAAGGKAMFVAFDTTTYVQFI